ncbi:MAG: hypothetical protein RIC30_11895 [Marinoscillum sp.]|uniref:HlyD family secretion protein n=1 Tax=Marinoscillum sp. TaxID=2024838 RepID=UPI0032FF02D3
MSKKLFVLIWIALGVSLAIISLRYKSRTEALVAVVESQVTAVSYQKPVIIERIYVIPGQEVNVGDTLVVVSRPDLNLDIEKKTNEQERMISGIVQANQDFLSKKELLTLEREGKINRLIAERSELQTELNQQTRIRQQLSGGVLSTTADSLKIIQLKAIETEISDLKRYYAQEIQRQRLQLNERLEIQKKEIELIEKELQALYDERNTLVKVAKFQGIVGTLDVHLDELVPAFKTLLSIYESHPSIIKAYINERFTSMVKPGDTVKVVSENRLYSITGYVKELGARITAYPGKIQSPTANAVSYGQEIFISIPTDNSFLNGEKVFVYPQTSIAP